MEFQIGCNVGGLQATQHREGGYKGVQRANKIR